mmetsp:Transcript_18968/g.52918  ORF Transcript_18968/g.52918 Transcript_18968/m.52918 type:complete len:398 (+) Transcript_18968:62-1255(+)
MGAAARRRPYLKTSWQSFSWAPRRQEVCSIVVIYELPPDTLDNMLKLELGEGALVGVPNNYAVDLLRDILGLPLFGALRSPSVELHSPLELCLLGVLSQDLYVHLEWLVLRSKFPVLQVQACAIVSRVEQPGLEGASLAKLLVPTVVLPLNVVQDEGLVVEAIVSAALVADPALRSHCCVPEGLLAREQGAGVGMEPPLKATVVCDCVVEVAVSVLLNSGTLGGVEQAHTEVACAREAPDLMINVALISFVLKVLSALFTVHSVTQPPSTDIILCFALTHPQKGNLGLIADVLDAPRFIEEPNDFRSLVVHATIGIPLAVRNPKHRLSIAIVLQRVGLMCKHPIPCDVSHLQARRVAQSTFLVIPGLAILPSVNPTPKELPPCVDWDLLDLDGHTGL